MPLAPAVRAITRKLDEFGPAWTARACAENLAVPFGPDVVSRIRRAAIRRDGLRFDRRHGTATAATGPAPEIDDAVRYEPTDERSFHWFLRRIDVPHGRYTFIDIGSGRGKVALMAARAGFRRVIGVEYDRALVREAEANVAASRNDAASRADRIRFETIDAGRLVPPGGPLVVWAFNPFGAATLERMLARYEASWREQPRSMVFGYYNALFPGVFERPWLRPVIPSTPLLIGDLVAFRSRDAAGS